MKKICKGLFLLLTCLFLGSSFTSCQNDSYFRTDKQAYAIMDNYFSHIQQTQYSGATVKKMKVAANKEGVLEIGSAVIGESETLQTSSYSVKKGVNVISFDKPIILEEGETLIVGGGKTTVRLGTETDKDQLDGALTALRGGVIDTTARIEKQSLYVEIEAEYFIDETKVDEAQYVKYLGKANLALALPGLNLSIIGDSISTFEGWSNSVEMNNTLANNKVTYPCAEIASVDTVEKTYWKTIADRYDMNVLVNNSYGGSKVSAASSAVSAGCMQRAQNLHANTGEQKGKQPDLIFVYLGTNDISGASTVRCGTYSGVSQIYDGTGYVIGENFDFAPAYAMMLHKIKSAYPKAKIFCFTTWYNIRHMPTNERKNQFDQTIRDIAVQFDADIVDIAKNNGVAREDFFDYADDGLHPNALGMQIIADLIEDVLIQSYR